MDWKRLLAYVTGSVDQEIRLRNEYLATENRILRGQLKGRLRLTDGERRSLAEVGKRLGRKALEEVAAIVRPETILDWHRRLVARKFDGSRHRRYPGRPPVAREVEKLVIRFAHENRGWGYDRIAGALANLGYTLSDQTVGNILARRGLAPAPERKKRTTWREFVRTHIEILAATDFFTAEVWTRSGLITYYVLFFVHLATRKVHVAGITPNPDAAWMVQMARNVTFADDGFLSPGRRLIHDRDSKYSADFVATLQAASVEAIELPANSPNLDAIAERWVRSVKADCLSRIIRFGERSLRRALEEYQVHYHRERNHQGKDNALLFPEEPIRRTEGTIRCRQRLGGLLRYDHREAG